MSETSLFDDYCELQVVSLAEDGYGSHTPTWQTVLANVPGRMQDISSHEAIEFAKVGRETSAYWYCDTLQPTPPGTSFYTINDIIKGDSTKRPIHRIKYINAGVTHYYEIEGSRDFDRRQRISRLDLAERDDGWVGS